MPWCLELTLTCVTHKRVRSKCLGLILYQCKCDGGEASSRSWEESKSPSLGPISFCFILTYYCCKLHSLWLYVVMYNKLLFSSAWPRMSQYLFALWPTPLCLALFMYLSQDTDWWFAEVSRLEPNSLGCVSVIHKIGMLSVYLNIFIYIGAFLDYFENLGACTLILTRVFLLVLQIMVVCYRLEMYISYLMEGLWWTQSEESGLGF